MDFVNLIRPKRLWSRIRRFAPTAVLDSLVATSGFILADFFRFGSRVSASGLAFSGILLFAIFGISAYVFGLHRRVWKHAGVDDAVAVAWTIAAGALTFSLFDLAIESDIRPYWLSTVPNGTILAFLLLLTLKLAPRLTAALQRRANSHQARAAGSWAKTLIVGAGETGAMLARDFQVNRGTRCSVVGFIDDDPGKQRRLIGGIRVLGTRVDIPAIVAQQGIDLIAIAIPSGTPSQIEELVKICQGLTARVQIVPSLGEIAARPNGSIPLRELAIGDLLGRDEIRLDVAACAHYLQDRVVLVTGAAGSIGAELCRQLCRLPLRRLIMLDINESGLFDLQAELMESGRACESTICMANIVDEQRIAAVFAQFRPHAVYHAAAYKHVPLLEEHPGEAAKTNVLGTAVLCRAADVSGAERFVFISSDKAVAPSNNLGYSKRIGELLVQAYGHGSSTIFCSVRFGNVIGSRGSVVQTFERQIALGGPLTVTHPDVTRFFMSIPEAVSLVIETAACSSGGSVFMLDMGKPISIVSLAEKMASLRNLRIGVDIEITFVGLRRGEKLHETLTTDLEHTRPTTHPKIMEVVDRLVVSRADLEREVRSLVELTGHGRAEDIVMALRQMCRAEAREDVDSGDSIKPLTLPLDGLFQSSHGANGASSKAGRDDPPVPLSGNHAALMNELES